MDLLLVALKKKLIKWQQLYSDQDEGKKIHEIINPKKIGTVLGLKDTSLHIIDEKVKDDTSVRQSIIEES